MHLTDGSISSGSGIPSVTLPTLTNPASNLLQPQDLFAQVHLPSAPTSTATVTPSPSLTESSEAAANTSLHQAVNVPGVSHDVLAPNETSSSNQHVPPTTMTVSTSAPLLNPSASDFTPAPATGTGRTARKRKEDVLPSREQTDNRIG